MRQKVCILGSTGSIGTSTLDVLARHPDRYEVFALSAHSKVDDLAAQCALHRPHFAAMCHAIQAKELRQVLRSLGLDTEVLEGEQALTALSSHPDVDIVMAAIVGAAGLAPCLAAARTGKRLLLANKEALVVGGAFFMDAVRQGGATLLPIDSEHSAIFQCLPENRQTWAQRIQKIILTASGGPFRETPLGELSRVTPAQACSHPNWVMGRKISVDSATMMNKALEVIEAHWLFDLPAEQIQVVIHPQSIIHSMVVCRDHSVLAQLGTPDMRVPIAYGLSFPDRMASGGDLLDFTSLSALTFVTPDTVRYPSLPMAWHTLKGPPGSTAVLNAANEAAVAAFLEGSIQFDQIHTVNHEVLNAVAVGSQDASSLEPLLDLDRRSRAKAQVIIRRLRQ